MPEYLSPGVYVEEIDAGPKPIQGVGTSTSGAVGVTVRGPTTGPPELITSFADYQRRFGGFLAEPPAAVLNRWALDLAEGGRWWTFPLAVKGFFDNGGQRLYVKRVFSADTVAATAHTGQGLVSELTADTAIGTQTITLRHLFGVAVGKRLTLFRGDTGAQVANPALAGGGFDVTAYDPATRRVELSHPVEAALTAGRDVAVINPRSADPIAAAERTLTFTARARGGWGNDLSVRVRPVIGNTLNVLPDPGAGPLQTTRAVTKTEAGDTTVSVADDPGFDAADPVPYFVRIDGHEYEVTAVAGGNPGETDLTVAPATLALLPVGTSVTKLRPATLADPKMLTLAGASSRLYPDAVVELDDGTAKELRVVASTLGEQVTFTAALGGTYRDGHTARVMEAEVAVRYAPQGGDIVDEVFSPLRLVQDTSGSSLIDHVNTASRLVEVAAGPNYSATDLLRFPTSPSGGWAPAASGDDRNDSLTVDDFVGVDGGSGARTGIQALEDIDDVAICTAPGLWSQTVRSALIQHCELLRDRFAIVDPPDGLSIEGVRSNRAPIDTRYAALYYPWLEVRDPSQGSNVIVPPSGHMAGIYARVDVDRGVHKAPANVVMRGITRFAQDVTKREQDLLNPEGINAFRYFPGRGYRVWGARTLSSDGSWKYINVRRLFIFVEESIDEGTQWVVFEPNSEDLWARVRATITNFLSTVWRNGALEGTSAEEAFFVACDRTTMSQDDIDNGRLICVIGIAPVKPAEFVIFRIQQKTREAQP